MAHRRGGGRGEEGLEGEELDMAGFMDVALQQHIDTTNGQSLQMNIRQFVWF